MEKMIRKLLSLAMALLLVLSLVPFNAMQVYAATDNVAKVGETGYATINEAIAAWTKGTTLTLLADVTLSDVITINTADNRKLDLGTYTMTAAADKNAIVIKAIGAGDSEQTTITIKADATNPGGINAGKKSVIYYKYADAGITTNDRPLIKIEGGVFTGATSSVGTAGIYTIGKAARQCATLNISGGTFNCSIYGSGKSKLLISGGTFHYSVGSQGDSTCYRLISGGTFKSFGFMTADAASKFGVGSGLSNYNKGVYVDDNGYLVVGGPVITEPGDQFAASSTNYSGWNSYLKYSSAAANGLYYTSAEEALADNNKTSGVVTLYTDELDLTNLNYKGTINMPATGELTVTFAEGTVPVWMVAAGEDKVVYTDTVVDGVVTRTYRIKQAPTGDAGIAYTSAETIWGECGGNAYESFDLKIYSDEVYLGKTSLNNIDGIIDGDVYVTWHAALQPEKDTDEYWTTTWEQALTSNVVPNKVELWIDGVMVDEGAIVMHGPDNLLPVEWETLEGVQFVCTGLKGAGTQDDPYRIGRIEELAWFRDDVNAGNTYAGKYVQLTENITLGSVARSAQTWTPIGTKAAPFKGNFDGNNKTVSNLVVVGEDNVGFFGYADNCTIENLTIENASVTGKNCVGGIAGQVYSTSTIDNCHVIGSVRIEGQTNVGGILGKYYAKVSNSSVIGDGAATSYVKGVYVAEDLEGDNVGGIMGHAGENNKSAGNTVKDITISGTRKVGGIIGITDMNTKISNCTVENVVVETTATADYAESKKSTMSIGGIVGQYTASGSTGTLTACEVSNLTFANENDVTVSAGALTGGMRGSSVILAPSVAIDVADTTISNINGATNTYLMVASVNGVSYLTLQAAVDAAQAGDEVVLLDDVTLTETLIVGADKVIALDLNGKTLTGSILAPDAELTVKNGSIVNADLSVSALEINAGKLTMTNVNVDSARHGLRIDGAVEATIDGGIYRGAMGSGTGTYHALNISGAATVTITTGTFIGPVGTTADSGCAVNVQAGATVIIEGGSFSGGKNNTLNAAGTLEIYGGTFDQAVNSKYCALGYVPTQITEGVYGVKSAVEAKIGNKSYATLAQAIAAAKKGDTVLLQANVIVTERIAIDKDITIADYNTYTISLLGNAGFDIKGGANVTFDQFNMDISGAVAKGDAIICIGSYSDVATLNLSDIKIIGDNYSSAYAVFYVYNTSELNIADSNITLSNDRASAGGFIKAEQGKDGVVNITDSVISLTDAKIGFLDGTVTMDGVELTIQGGANAINQSALTVRDSVITIDGADGRALTLSQGEVSVYNSQLNFSNCTEGEIRFKKGLKLRIDGASTISNCTVYADAAAVDVANINGYYVNGIESNKSKIVNGELMNPAWESKIGTTYYLTIAEAMSAAQAGDTVTILAGDYTGDLSVNKAITVVGEGEVNFAGKLNITADGAAVKNLNFNNGSGNAGYISAEDVLVEGCTVVGGNGFRYCYTSGTVTFKDSTITGTTYGIHFDGNAGGNIVINNCDITGWTSFAGSITKVTMTDTNFAEGNYNQLRFYQDVEMTGCTFNPKMTIDFGKNGVSADFTDCSVTDGSDLTDVIYLPDLVNMGIDVTVDSEKIIVVAMIGDNCYFTFAEAFAAAQPGDTVTILAGEYNESLNVNKAITVVGETDAEGNNLVKLNGGITISGDNAAVKNLTASNPATSGYDCTLSISAANVLVEGCEITDTHAMRFSSAKGAVTLKDCVLTATDTWAIHFDNGNGPVVVEGCEINGWVAFNGDLDKVTLKDSSFTKGDWSGGRTYNKDVEISGCTFENGYKFDLASSGADVTVTDSVVTGGDITSLFNGNDATTANNITIDGEPLRYVARIGGNNGTYYKTLEDALAAVTDYTTITLVDNAMLDYNAREAYGRASTTDIIIKGEGYTLTLNQKDSDWSSIGMANPQGKLTLKNMTVEKTGYGDTSGAWNTHAINFTCNVEMTDVVVNNSMSVENGATLKNVTINEANGYYGLWIDGNGQTVTVNGGSINATNGGRGIKIADQYVDAPASVTLDVTNTKFTTAKKAAVLVSSTAGAKVTANGCDISGVAEDTVNFVWVDEDWSDYYDEVEVYDEATKAQESAADFAAFVADESGEITAYYKTLAAAIAAAADGDTVTVQRDISLAESVTVRADQTVVLDLNGKTITGTDTTEKNFGLINNNGNLTVKDSVGGGKMTVTATVNSGWNRYSAVISNNPGGKLTVESGVIEHLGGTDMAYGIDSLTNGGIGDVSVTINGGQIKSTYRGIRQFLNSDSRENVLTVNGGTVEGENKAIFFHDPSKKANSGTLTVGEDADINGGIYLYVTEGSEQWPVQVSIAAAALDDNGVNTANVPAGYEVANVDGTYGIYFGSAKIGNTYYATLQEAVDAAQADDIIVLLADVDADEVVIVKKPVTIIANGFAITEDNVACMKYTNADGKKSQLTCDETAEGLIVKVAQLTVVEAGDPLAYVDIDMDGKYDAGEEELKTLQAALDAAAKDQFVRLTGDLTVNSTIIIPAGVILDIQANDLTVKTLIGLNGSKLTGVVYATDGTAYGKLVVAPTNLVLSNGAYAMGAGFEPNNIKYALPVYNSNYYVFTGMEVDTDRDYSANRGLWVNTETKTIDFQFVLNMAKTVRTGLLNNGANDNELKVVVRLQWENADGSGVAYQDYVYSEEFIAKVCAGGYDFGFTMTGYDAVGINVDTLVVKGMVIANSGVEVVGLEWNGTTAESK